MLRLRHQLTSLLIVLLLGMPGIALADHMHEDYNDEINCELCNYTNPGASSDSQPDKLRCDKDQPQHEKKPRLPFEVYRLNQFQRGPPFLR